MTPKGRWHIPLWRSEHGYNLGVLRMKLACLMKRGTSPGNMPQVFSCGGYQSILNHAVLRLWKVGYCPWSNVTVPILPLCIQSWSMHKWLVMFGTERCRNHVWCGHLHPRKANSNAVSQRIFKHGGSSWRLHIALKYLSMLGKKFRFYISDLGNISVYGLMIYIKILFRDFG